MAMWFSCALRYISVNCSRHVLSPGQLKAGGDPSLARKFPMILLCFGGGRSFQLQWGIFNFCILDESHWPENLCFFELFFSQSS